MDGSAYPARGGNGGHSGDVIAEADNSSQTPLVDEPEASLVAAQPKADSRTAQRTATALVEAQPEAGSRAAQRRATLLAHLKAQLKQQAAETLQLEEMLKQADVELSSAASAAACSPSSVCICSAKI